MSQLHFKIKKGLDLPITGQPEAVIEAGNAVDRVALLGADAPGLRPTMLVREDDRVQQGQPLFTDKRNPGVIFTAPAAGRVVAIHRAAKRAFESLVIARDGEAAVTFERRHPSGSNAADTRALLIASGLWTAFRTRPYSRIPRIDAKPDAIFVNAMDSNPLAADPTLILKGREEDFKLGLRAIAKLTDGKLYLCSRAGTRAPGEDLPEVTIATFEGPHPSGLTGTHVHLLHPVTANRSVWSIGYQDVIAIGVLAESGKLDASRVVSLAGPAAKKPRLVSTVLGADLKSLTLGETTENARVISGSPLCGRALNDADHERFGFLGRYHVQVSVLPEGGQRRFLGWQMPGSDQYSATNAFVSAIGRARRRFAFDTSANGSPRAMVPIGAYERVVPLDTNPTFLLRSLLTGDTDLAQQLGVLELDEEDVALCTFVCPGKTDYAPLLRAALNTIEKDG